MVGPMRPLTILRTGAGSAVAPFVIGALRDAGARVVAADMSASAVGFSFADRALTLPAASSDALVPRLLAACETEDVDVLFPDVDEEFAPLARARAEFDKIGVRLLLSGVDTVDSCTDKLRFAGELARRGLPSPSTLRAADLSPDAAFPLFVKPRTGRGSAHSVRVGDRAELACALRHVPDPLVQPFLPGAEYSIDTLSTMEGRFLYASVRERLATDSGISTRGRTVEWPDLEALAATVIEALGIIGPACLQCILDASGAPQFTDCNPRLGGGVALSVEAGAPIVQDIVRLLRSQPPQGKTRYRAGLVMLRSWRETYVDPLLRVRAVTLDLDDTLYDRREHIDGALAAVADAIAAATHLDRQELAAGLGATWQRLGSDHPRIFDVWLTESGLSTDHAPLCVEAFHSFAPARLALRPGVADALLRLRARGVRCAIVTDGRSSTQHGKVRALGLDDLVDEVICCTSPKPDPQALLEAIRRLGVSPGQVLHVGDHPRADVVMAKRAGAIAARLLAGEFAARPADVEGSADLFCADLPRLLDRVAGAEAPP